MWSKDVSTQAHCQAINAAARGPSAVTYTAACHPRRWSRSQCGREEAGEPEKEEDEATVSHRMTKALANCGVGWVGKNAGRAFEFRGVANRNDFAKTNH